MADLEVTLAWIGMSQYYERFVEAGFDSWETVLEITEADLEALDVEPVHRRKLQKEIAITCGLAQEPAVGSALLQSVTSSESTASVSNFSKPEPSLPSSAKRGYRHHPKPDEKAPQRPHSAYVLFSNHVREELKDRSLSFSETSRLVGERWQAMSPAQKDGWKQKAVVPWEKYKRDMAEYKRTEEYRNHAQYLDGFQATQENKKAASKAQNKQAPSFEPAHITDSASLAASQSRSFPSSQTFRDRSGSKHPISSLDGDAKRQETGVPITRVRPSAASHSTPNSRIARVSQACEPCRSRKSKCNGERPICKHCHDLDLECHYEDGKKDKGKRLTEQLWKKVAAYENLLLRNASDLSQDQQSAIQRALLMPPEAERDPDMVSPATGQSTTQEHGSDSGGESEASGVGSMGSTGHVNEENLLRPGSANREQPFLGQSSDTRWMQMLTTDLTSNPEDSMSGQGQDNGTAPAESNPTALQYAALSASRPEEGPDDVDSPFTEDQVDPYGLPIKSIADTLIDIYFATIHPSFPVLDHNLFLDEYLRYVASAEPREARYRTFVPILQLVLAISAIHAHMTHSEWAGHDRDHSLYYARAQALASESGLLRDVVYSAQVQTFGLSAMYFLATHQINRAWNVLGIAIRCAQALGMHLENNLHGLKDEAKLTRVRMWFAIVSLERMLSLVTGRPPMVKQADCSAPVPLPASLSDDESFRGTSTSSQILSPDDFLVRLAGTTSSTLSSSAQGPKRYDKPTESITMTFFFYYLELNALGQRVLEGLYGPHIRHTKWSVIQDRISDLDAQLSQWSMTLPAALDITASSKDPRTASFSVALAILSNSLRTIINRPSLCSKDRRVPHQSNSSVQTNHDSANKCVSSARAVLALLPTEPDPYSIRQSPVWWTIVYHIKRAVTVLMLEMAVRAKHMPSEAEEILKDAKKAVNWLRSMASTSSAARQSWEILSRLLVLAAQRIGGVTEDIITTPIDRLSGFMPDFQPSAECMSIDPRSFDPNIWEPMDFMGYRENSFLPNAQMGAHVGSIDLAAAQYLFPTMNSMNTMAFSQPQQQGEDVPQAERTQDWFGFDPSQYGH